MLGCAIGSGAWVVAALVVARELAPHRSGAAPTGRAAGRLASSARAKARPPLGSNTAHARPRARRCDWERRVGCICFGCRAGARRPLAPQLDRFGFADLFFCCIYRFFLDQYRIRSFFFPTYSLEVLSGAFLCERAATGVSFGQCNRPRQPNFC